MNFLRPNLNAHFSRRLAVGLVKAAVAAAGGLMPAVVRNATATLIIICWLVLDRTIACAVLNTYAHGDGT